MKRSRKKNNQIALPSKKLEETKMKKSGRGRNKKKPNKNKNDTKSIIKETKKAQITKSNVRKSTRNRNPTDEKKINYVISNDITKIKRKTRASRGVRKRYNRSESKINKEDVIENTTLDNENKKIKTNNRIKGKKIKKEIIENNIENDKSSSTEEDKKENDIVEKKSYFSWLWKFMPKLHT